jgi:hypothetical protein
LGFYDGLGNVGLGSNGINGHNTARNRQKLE